MNAANFYEIYLKNKSEFKEFIQSFMSKILPSSVNIENCTPIVINYLFYDNNEFLYKLKYITFRQVNGEYLSNLFDSFIRENQKWVDFIWHCCDNKYEAKDILSHLGNKKIEVIKTITMPSFKSLENDVKNGDIITNMLNSIVNHLQEMQKNQNMMLANISHEMRTPLNSVIGYLDVLDTVNNLSPENRKNVIYAKNSSKLLLTLINDLLDTQKLSNATLDLINNPFWVNKVIKNAVLISSISANQKNINFSFIDNTNIFTEVLGDKNRFLQILNNLLNNAIKFTPPEGKVEIVVDSKDLDDSIKLEIQVKDNGIGIPKNKQKELFKPFSRATNKEKGTGLGLYISRQLAIRMGGNIWFESEENKGTTFYLEVKFNKSENYYQKEILNNRKIVLFNEKPQKYCNTLQKQLHTMGAKVKIMYDLDKFMNFLIFNKDIDMVIIVYPNSIQDNDLDKSFIKTYRKLNEKSIQKICFLAGVDENYYPKNSDVFDKVINTPITVLDILEVFTNNNYQTNNYKYLIIDDEPMNRMVLTTMIKTFDKKSHIETATNGMEGLEKLKTEKYDIVFLDKRMPYMNGYEVLEELKKLNIKANIYLLTADGDNETIQKTKEFNVGYIAKPVTMATLKNVVSEIAGGGGE